MRALSLVLLSYIITAASACKSLDCGTGTIERDGTCQPADETTGTAMCGPFTMIQGNQCVPMFPPAICDPATTNEDPGDDGVITCVGNGSAAGCSQPISCPNPSSGKQTICGQLYNFADNSKFAASGATGTQCGSTPASSGPCALQILAFDAVVFANNSTAVPPVQTTPQQVGDVYIDDCGRYRLKDISPPAGPFLALGFDDAGQPLGPTGVTVTTGVALPTSPDSATKNFEAWIAEQATIGSWTSSGGPSFANGIYAPVFRAHVCDASSTCADPFSNQSGVTFTKMGSPVPANDYYFMASDNQNRLHIDTTSATSANGTGLAIGTSVNDSLVYSGTGGITDTGNCQWEPHAAANVPGLLFIQVYKKTNKLGKTCTE
ncbi:MAG: hypothetical protein ABI678_05395 [Kofleriaceae bacterium]